MNFPQYQTVQVSPHDDNVLLVTLNRPEVLNALNTQMGHDLLDLWLRLTVDAATVRCVILTGSGSKGFCAGGDLKERDGMTQAAWQAQHELFERSFVALMELPIPNEMEGKSLLEARGTDSECERVGTMNAFRRAAEETRVSPSPRSDAPWKGNVRSKPASRVRHSP